MLRTQRGSSVNNVRNTATPQVRPTNDNHPLLLSLPDHCDYRCDDDFRLSAASQLSLLNDRDYFPHEKIPRSRSADPRPSASAVTATSPTNKRVKEDVLTEVYVHVVKKTDTLPKIILQYRIPAAILRRANRMYANDSIGFRDTLLLPVDACEITPTTVSQGAETSLPSSPLAFTSSAIPQSMTRSVSSQSHLSSTLQDDLRDSTHLATRPTRPTLSRCMTPKREKSSSGIDGPFRNLHVMRQVVIDGIGQVDVTQVPASSLSYFPPSLTPISPDRSSRVTGIPPQTHYQYVSRRWEGFGDEGKRDREPESGRERGSFESIRIGAGKVAADAYNGTQGLIRRMKERKQQSEIDLIEL